MHIHLNHLQNLKVNAPRWLGAGLLLFGLLSSHVTKAEPIVLVTPLNTVDTVISEVILRTAYKRIGIDVEIRKLPAERALRMADDGKVTGEVQRIFGIDKTYTNLVRIDPFINYIEASVFSREQGLSIKGKDSLRGHRVCIIRGIKFAERLTAGMDVVLTKDYTMLFKMLVSGRCELALSPKFNGLYNMKLNGIDKIYPLSPALERFDLYHYIHTSHKALIPKITSVLKAMHENGELGRIREQVMQVVYDRAAQGNKPCDDDYACFEGKD
ncbi:MAG: hypothetical protein COB46_08915 [Rhodospirillaceae bacterium]|nr:MAG: hypothetical protein COB46_08915 [Rhodospirillaceae bacterium]